MTDKRYESEYKPLIKYYRIAARDHLLTEEQFNQLIDQAVSLLIDMGWPYHSLAAADKVFADINEIVVEELALQYEQEGKKINHDIVAKKHFKKFLRRALSYTERERKYRVRKQHHKKQ